jgi:hypothetical protein
MPTVRQLVKTIMAHEKLDPPGEEGYYPLMFNSDWAKFKFVLLFRIYKFWGKVKKRLKIWNR